MSRGCVAILMALGLLIVAPAAQATASLPPDLVALEQQMAQLQVNTERFSVQEELEFNGLGALLGGSEEESAPLVLVIAGDGEASTTPPELTMTAGLFGAPVERIRQIGETLYTYRREIGKFDGHRPWVRSHSKSPQSGSESIDVGGLLEGDQPGAQGTFSGLVQELNGAESVTESGPVTVDGQRVIEFDAALDPTPLLEKLRSKSKSSEGASENPLAGLGEAIAPKSKAHKKASPPPSLELEVFIAPNGLPVRVRVTAQIEGTTVSERVDTLAINIPVSVQPPPASETIDKAALETIERRRQRRERAALLKACRRANSHSKHKIDCARLVAS